MKGAIWGGMAKCDGGGAGWLAPKNKACCRRLSGKRIYANRKRIVTYGLCYVGPRQRLEPIYLRAGGKTGVFYMEANLCKSETNLRLTVHVGGQQVRAESATAPRWIAGRWCRAAQIIIKSKHIGATSLKLPKKIDFRAGISGTINSFILRKNSQ